MLELNILLLKNCRFQKTTKPIHLKLEFHSPKNRTKPYVICIVFFLFKSIKQRSNKYVRLRVISVCCGSIESFYMQIVHEICFKMLKNSKGAKFSLTICL